MSNFLEKNSINLSIIKPPYHKVTNDPSKHIHFLKEIMQKVTTATKIGGICCLIISDDMTEEGMDLTETRALLAMEDDSRIGSHWVFFEKLFWVKSTEKGAESEFSTERIKAVSFDVTPFSSIWILVKSENEEDYQELDIYERIQKLKISDAKKHEMQNSLWYIPQSSETGYKDHLPKELILRLLMIFSEENDLVLDPFSGNGITGIASKMLKRHFICIEKNLESYASSKKRFEMLIRDDL